jgi:hypothetical protein
MKTLGLYRDSDAELLCEVIRRQAEMSPIAKFRTLDDAHQFWRAKGRLEYTPCASTDKDWPWMVRPKTDVEKEQDAYYREFPR